MLTPKTPSRKTLAASLSVREESVTGITTAKNTFTKVIVNDGITVTTRTRKVSDVTRTELSPQGALLLLAGALTEGQ